MKGRNLFTCYHATSPLFQWADGIVDESEPIMVDFQQRRRFLTQFGGSTSSSIWVPMFQLHRKPIQRQSVSNLGWFFQFHTFAPPVNHELDSLHRIEAMLQAQIGLRFCGHVPSKASPVRQFWHCSQGIELWRTHFFLTHVVSCLLSAGRLQS